VQFRRADSSSSSITRGANSISVMPLSEGTRKDRLIGEYERLLNMGYQLNAAHLASRGRLPVGSVEKPLRALLESRIKNCFDYNSLMNLLAKIKERALGVDVIAIGRRIVLSDDFLPLRIKFGTYESFLHYFRGNLLEVEQGPEGRFTQGNALRTSRMASLFLVTPDEIVQIASEAMEWAEGCAAARDKDEIVGRINHDFLDSTLETYADEGISGTPVQKYEAATEKGWHGIAAMYARDEIARACLTGEKCGLEGMHVEAALARLLEGAMKAKLFGQQCAYEYAQRLGADFNVDGGRLFVMAGMGIYREGTMLARYEKLRENGMHLMAAAYAKYSIERVENCGLGQEQVEAALAGHLEDAMKKLNLEYSLMHGEEYARRLGRDFGVEGEKIFLEAVQGICNGMEGGPLEKFSTMMDGRLYRLAIFHAKSELDDAHIKEAATGLLKHMKDGLGEDCAAEWAGKIGERFGMEGSELIAAIR